MPSSNGNGITLPVTLQIQNLQSLVDSLQKQLGNLKVGSSGFKSLQTVIKSIKDEIDKLSIQSSKPFIDEKQFTRAENSVEKLENEISKVSLVMSRIKFNDIELTPAQKNDLKAFEQQVNDIKNSLKTVKETAKQQFLDSDLGKAWTQIDDKAFNQTLGQITNNIEREVNKQKGILQEAEKAFNDYQNALKGRNSIQQFLEAKGNPLDEANIGQKMFDSIFKLNAKTNELTFQKGGRSVLSSYLQKQLSLSDAEVESLTKESIGKGQKVFDTIRQNLERILSEKNAKINANSNAEQQYKDAEAYLENLNQMLQQAGLSESSVASITAALREELERTTGNWNNYKDAVTNAARGNQQTQNTCNAMKQQLESFRSTLDQTNASFLQMQRTQQSFNQMKMAIVNFMGFNQVLNLSKRAIKEAINHIKELDSVMNKISIVTDMNTEDLWQQVDAYSKMAQAYGVSIKGAYEVSQIYYQQGLQTADVLTLTNETLKLAKISGLDYATTTDYMTTALRGFKMEMSEASTVVDVYSNLAAHTAVSQEELAVAMSKTASSMESVGSTFEEASAMIGTMVAVTRESATNIGSALKSIASRYGEMKSDPSILQDAEGEAIAYNKVDAALQSVGITLKTTDGQFRNFTDVILELSEVWDQLESTQQRYIATQFAGNRQQSRFLALVSNPELLKANINYAEDSEDTGTLQALKALDSIESKIEQVRVAYQQFYTTMGIENVWKGFLDGAKNVINTLNSLPKLFGKIPLGAIAAVSNVIILIKNLLTRGIQGIASIWTSALNKSGTQATTQGQTIGKNLMQSIESAIKAGTPAVQAAINAALSLQQQSSGDIVPLNKSQQTLFNIGKSNITRNNSDWQKLAQQYNKEGLMSDVELASAVKAVAEGNEKAYEEAVRRSNEAISKQNGLLRENTAETNGNNSATASSTTTKIGFFEKLKDGSSKLNRGLSATAMALTTVGMVLDKSSKAGRIASGVFTTLGGVMQTSTSAARLFAGDWSALPQLITGVINIVNGFGIAIETPAERLERLTQEAEELNNQAKEAKANYRTLDNSIKKIDELKEKRYESAEAAEEYQTAVDELAEKFPQMIAGFDEAGNIILDTTDAERILTEARNKSKEATYAAAEAELKKAEEQKSQAKTALKEAQGKLDVSLFADTADEGYSVERRKYFNTKTYQDLKGNERNIKDLITEGDFIGTLQTISSVGTERELTVDEVVEGVKEFNIALQKIGNEAYSFINDFNGETAKELFAYMQTYKSEHQISELTPEFFEIEQLINEQLQTQINTAYQNAVEAINNLSELDVDDENFEAQVEVVNKAIHAYQNLVGENSPEFIRFDNVIAALGDVNNAMKDYINMSEIYQGNSRAVVSAWQQSSTANSQAWDILSKSSFAAAMVTEQIVQEIGDGNYDQLVKQNNETKKWRNYQETMAEFISKMDEETLEAFNQMGNDTANYTAEDIIEQFNIQDDIIKSYIIDHYSNGIASIRERLRQVLSQVSGNNYDTEISSFDNIFKDEFYRQFNNIITYKQLTTTEEKYLNNILSQYKSISDKGYTTRATQFGSAAIDLFNQISEAPAEIEKQLWQLINENGLTTLEGIKQIQTSIQNNTDLQGYIDQNVLDTFYNNIIPNINLEIQTATSNLLETWEDTSKELSQAMSNGVSLKEADALITKAEALGLDKSITLDDFQLSGDKLILTKEAYTRYYNGIIKFDQDAAQILLEHINSAEQVIQQIEENNYSLHSNIQYENMRATLQSLGIELNDYVDEYGRVSEAAITVIEAAIEESYKQLGYYNRAAQIAVDQLNNSNDRSQGIYKLHTNDKTGLTKQQIEAYMDRTDLSWTGDDITIRAIIDEASQVYNTLMSDVFSKGWEKINLQDYEGLIDSDIANLQVFKDNKDYVGFAQEYGKLAGKTIDEVNDLILQVYTKDNEKFSEDLIKDFTFLDKNAFRATRDSLTELANAYDINIETMIEKSKLAFDEVSQEYIIGVAQLADAGVDLNKIHYFRETVQESVDSLFSEISSDVSSALSGKLSEKGRTQLIENLASFGETPILNFTRTAEGLQLTEDSFFNLYTSVNKLDRKLAKSLLPDLTKISRQYKTLGDVLRAYEKELDKDKRATLRDLASEFLRNPESYNLMGREMPSTWQAADVFYGNTEKAAQATKQIGTGKISASDFSALMYSIADNTQDAAVRQQVMDWIQMAPTFFERTSEGLMINTSAMGLTNQLQLITSMYEGAYEEVQKWGSLEQAIYNELYYGSESLENADIWEENGTLNIDNLMTIIESNTQQGHNIETLLKMFSIEDKTLYDMLSDTENADLRDKLIAQLSKTNWDWENFEEQVEEVFGNLGVGGTITIDDKGQYKLKIDEESSSITVEYVADGQTLTQKDYTKWLAAKAQVDGNEAEIRTEGSNKVITYKVGSQPIDVVLDAKGNVFYRVDYLGSKIEATSEDDLLNAMRALGWESDEKTITDNEQHIININDVEYIINSDGSVVFKDQTQEYKEEALANRKKLEEYLKQVQEENPIDLSDTTVVNGDASKVQVGITDDTEVKLDRPIVSLSQPLPLVVGKTNVLIINPEEVISSKTAIDDVDIMNGKVGTFNVTVDNVNDGVNDKWKSIIDPTNYTKPELEAKVTELVAILENPEPDKTELTNALKGWDDLPAGTKYALVSRVLVTLGQNAVEAGTGLDEDYKAKVRTLLSAVNIPIDNVELIIQGFNLINDTLDNAKIDESKKQALETALQTALAAASLTGKVELAQLIITGFSNPETSNLDLSSLLNEDGTLNLDSISELAAKATISKLQLVVNNITSTDMGAELSENGIELNITGATAKASGLSKVIITDKELTAVDEHGVPVTVPITPELADTLGLGSLFNASGEYIGEDKDNYKLEVVAKVLQSLDSESWEKLYDNVYKNYKLKTQIEVEETTNSGKSALDNFRKEWYANRNNYNWIKEQGGIDDTGAGQHSDFIKENGLLAQQIALYKEAVQLKQTLGSADVQMLTQLKNLGATWLTLEDLADIDSILTQNTLNKSDLQAQIQNLTALSNIESGNLDTLNNALDNLQATLILLQGIEIRPLLEKITNIKEAIASDESGDGHLNLFISADDEEVEEIRTSIQAVIDLILADHKLGLSSDVEKVVSDINSALDKLTQITRTIHIDVETNGPAVSTGKIIKPLDKNKTESKLAVANGNIALAAGRRQTLMGELGPEMYVQNGHYYIAGQNGPEMVSLADDAIVFNHIQTRRLLAKGSTFGHGKPVTNEYEAAGIAHANGTSSEMDALQYELVNTINNIKNLDPTFSDYDEKLMQEQEKRLELLQRIDDLRKKTEKTVDKLDDAAEQQEDAAKQQQNVAKADKSNLVHSGPAAKYTGTGRDFSEPTTTTVDSTYNGNRYKGEYFTGDTFQKPVSSMHSSNVRTISGGGLGKDAKSAIASAISDIISKGIESIDLSNYEKLPADLKNEIQRAIEQGQSYRDFVVQYADCLDKSTKEINELYFEAWQKDLENLGQSEEIMNSVEGLTFYASGMISGSSEDWVNLLGDYTKVQDLVDNGILMWNAGIRKYVVSSVEDLQEFGTDLTNILNFEDSQADSSKELDNYFSESFVKAISGEGLKRKEQTELKEQWRLAGYEDILEFDDNGMLTKQSIDLIKNSSKKAHDAVVNVAQSDYEEKNKLFQILQKAYNKEELDPQDLDFLEQHNVDLSQLNDPAYIQEQMNSISGDWTEKFINQVHDKQVEDLRTLTNLVFSSFNNGMEISFTDFEEKIKSIEGIDVDKYFEQGETGYVVKSFESILELYEDILVKAPADAKNTLQTLMGSIDLSKLSSEQIAQLKAVIENHDFNMDEVDAALATVDDALLERIESISDFIKNGIGGSLSNANIAALKQALELDEINTDNLDFKKTVNGFQFTPATLKQLQANIEEAFNNGKIDEVTYTKYANIIADESASYLKNITDTISKGLSGGLSNADVTAFKDALEMGGIGADNLQFKQTTQGLQITNESMNALLENISTALANGKIDSTIAQKYTDTILDATKEYLDTLTNSISDGLSGTLSNADITSLKEALEFYNLDDLDLHFDETAKGLKLSTESAITLYNELRKIDVLQAKLVFDELRTSLEETNDDYKTMTSLITHIVDLQKEIAQSDKYSSEKIKQYKEELSLAKEIALARATSKDDSMNFLDQEIPAAMNNPLNYINDWITGIKGVRDAIENDTAFDFTRMYNMIDEMNSLASLTADGMNFLGMQLDGSIETFDAAIMKTIDALGSDANGTYGVLLNQLSGDLLDGAGNYVDGVDSAIHIMSQEQIKMLDFLINIFETLVALEGLGKLDTDENGIFNLDDIFDYVMGENNEKQIKGFNKKFESVRQEIIDAITEGSDTYNVELKAAMEKVKINGKSLVEVIKQDASEWTVSDAEVLNALIQAVQSKDYDLNNISESVRAVLMDKLNNGVLEIDGIKLTAKYGFLVEEKDGKYLDNKGNQYDTLEDAARATKLNNLGAISNTLEPIEMGTEMQGTILMGKQRITVVTNGENTTYRSDKVEGDFTSIPSLIRAEWEQYANSTEGVEVDNTQAFNEWKIVQEYTIVPKLSDKQIDTSGISKDQVANLVGATYEDLAQEWDKAVNDNNTLAFEAKYGISFDEASEEKFTELQEMLGIETKHMDIVASITTAADESQAKIFEAITKGSADISLNVTTVASGDQAGTPTGTTVTNNILTDTTESQQNMRDLSTAIDETIKLVDQLSGMKVDKDTSSAVTSMDRLSDAINTTINNVKTLDSTSFSINTSDTYDNIHSISDELHNINKELKELKDKEIDGVIKFKVETSSSGGSEAKGSFGAALAAGKETLMGELGPELYVTGGRYYVAGRSGAEFVNLPNDAIVFNHLQTQRLLGSGSTGRGTPITNEKNAISFARGNVGNAMASAKQTLATLKQLRAMWQSLEKSSIKDLIGVVATNSSGTDRNKSTAAMLKDIERWYNWLQRIARLEKEINYQETLRKKLQSDMITDGTAYYRTQVQSLDNYRRQAATEKDLYESQEAYFYKRQEELNNSPLGRFYQYDNAGQIYFTDNGFAELEAIIHQSDVGETLTPQQQYELIKSYDDANHTLEYFMERGMNGLVIDRGDYETDDEFYAARVEALWDRMESEREEMQSLYDSKEQLKIDYLEDITSANEILKEIVDNQLSIEEKVVSAIEHREQQLIDQLSKEREALEKSSNAYISGLQKALNKEQQMYKSNESRNELEQLQRKLALLQRSGGSATEIASLSKEITNKQKDMYFDAQQEQIDAVQEASDLQLEKMQNQIDIMTETLEYAKQNGLLWNEAIQIMKGDASGITRFITENSSDWASKSIAAQTAEIRDLLPSIEQWIGFRDNVDGNLANVQAMVNNGFESTVGELTEIGESVIYSQVEDLFSTLHEIEGLPVTVASEKKESKTKTETNTESTAIEDLAEETVEESLTNEDKLYETFGPLLGISRETWDKYRANGQLSNNALMNLLNDNGLIEGYSNLMARNKQAMSDDFSLPYDQTKLEAMSNYNTAMRESGLNNLAGQIQIMNSSQVDVLRKMLRDDTNNKPIENMNFNFYVDKIDSEVDLENAINKAYSNIFSDMENARRKSASNNSIM